MSVSIRVMGLPAEVGRAVIEISEHDGFNVTTIRGPYGNRDGAQVRVYVTANLTTLETQAKEG